MTTMAGLLLGSPVPSRKGGWSWEQLVVASLVEQLKVGAVAVLIGREARKTGEQSL